MSNGYGWLKVGHVLAVIVWLGGSLTLSFLTGALLRRGDREAVKSFLREAGFFGPIIVGPASLLTLVTGLGMALMSRAFNALWVQIGFGGIVLHFILGAGLIRAASLRLQHLLEDPAADPSAVAAAGSRLRVLNVVYLLVLFVVAAVMILKP